MLRTATIFALLGLATPALATDITEPFSGSRPHTLEFHGGFTFYGAGVAGGVRYGIPLVQNGFIGPINNSVYLGIGADFYALSNISTLDRAGVGVGIPVVMQWNFYFTDDWSAFGEVGVNTYFDTYTFEGNGVLVGGNWLVSALGGRYHFRDDMAVIGRVGSPYASIGIELSL